jgi:hypothetical protein
MARNCLEGQRSARQLCGAKQSRAPSDGAAEIHPERTFGLIGVLSQWAPFLTLRPVTRLGAMHLCHIQEIDPDGVIDFGDSQ